MVATRRSDGQTKPSATNVTGNGTRAKPVPKPKPAPKPKPVPKPKPSSKKTIASASTSKSTTPRLDNDENAQVTMSAGEIQRMKDELSSFRKLQAAQKAKEQKEQKKKASRALVAQAVRAERDESVNPFAGDLNDDDDDELVATPSDAEEDDLANRLPPVKTQSRSIQKRHLGEDDLEGEGGDADTEDFQRGTSTGIDDGAMHLEEDDLEGDAGEGGEPEPEDSQREKPDAGDEIEYQVPEGQPVEEEEGDEVVEKVRDNGIIVEDEEKTPFKLKRKRSAKGERKERPRLSNFNTDHVDLANLGHRHLRIHVAVKDAFPNSIIKNQISYKILSSAVKALQDPAIAKSLESLEEDVDAKMKVLEYIWGATSQLRGELVNKARAGVEGAYCFQGMKAEKVRDIVVWLLGEGYKDHGDGDGDGEEEEIINPPPFMCGDVDSKAKTFSTAKAFLHSFIKTLIRDQWFSGRNADGIAHSKLFRNCPYNLICLVVTSIECALRSFSNGVKSKHAFDERYFSTRFEYYVDMFRALLKDAPNYTSNLQRQMYDDVLTLARLEYLHNVGYDEEEERPGKKRKYGFDFASLERAAS